MCVCVCCLLCRLFPLCPSPWIFKRSRNGQNGCDLHRCCVKDQHCSSVGSFCQPCLTAMAPHKGIGETILQIIMSHQISSKHINHKSKKGNKHIFALSQPQLLTSLPWHWVKIPKTKYSYCAHEICVPAAGVPPAEHENAKTRKRENAKHKNAKTRKRRKRENGENTIHSVVL